MSNLLNKVTSLNPNAAEFVPSSIKYTRRTAKTHIKLDPPGSSEKAGLDRSEATTSNISDDEAQQYWQNQLPDDITPDFKVMVEEEMQGPEHLSFAALSLHDGAEPSRVSTSMTNQILGTKKDMFTVDSDNLNFSEKMGYVESAHSEGQSSSGFMNPAVNSWGKPFVNGKHHSIIGREEYFFNGDPSPGLVNNRTGDNGILHEAAGNPIEFLSSHFPGFAVQNLVDVYYGNGCDLSLTIEILTQFKLQVDAGFSQNGNSKSHPNLNMLDFPALPVADSQNGLSNYSENDAQRAFNAYGYSSGSLRGDIDFASAVKKLASKDGGNWRYGRHNAADGVGVGSSRSSRILASSHNGHGNVIHGDKLQSSGGAPRCAPIWLETGEAVGSMYSESREEARDHARLRNACFEQAKQAYLMGNKAFAKELGLKGQWYNMQMKAAHEKSRETIYRQRNSLSTEFHGYSGGQEPLLDLHGLHVSEAIHVLSHELSIMKSTARSTGQRQQVMICVGTGHHTKGARTPARLPVAVEQYLLDEGFHFTQPQAGVLRVVVY